MRKVIAALLILWLLAIGLFLSCSSSKNLTNKEDIIKLFNENKDTITSAVEKENFDEIEKIRGIESVFQSENYIDFSCGGAGGGSGTQYYGFFYSAEDNLTAWNGGACPADALYAWGSGYKYTQTDGDNAYYVEKIAEHFFTMRQVFEMKKTGF